MKILYFFCILVFITSCGKAETGPLAGSNTIDIGKNITISGSKFQIFIIDGCEYIGYDLLTNSGVFTHKGNCKNHK